MKDFKKLLEHFQRFNRKERYHLLRQVLGLQNFEVSEAFRAEIEKALKIEVPANCFWAMDFHFDWIYTCLDSYKHGGITIGHPVLQKENTITGNQQDVDLLISFFDEDTFYIIMIEAKVESRWDETQLQSKLDRMNYIFGENNDAFEAIKPFFILASPKKPPRYEQLNAPKWVDAKRIPYIKIDVPGNFLKYTRCNERSKSDKNGRFYKII